MTVLFALGAISGCAQNGEPLSPNEAKPDQEPQTAKLPEAPAPRDKAGRENWPKLLIGTWRQVQPRSTTEVTCEFATNGIVTMRFARPDGVRTQSMAYKLVGDTFDFPDRKVEDNAIILNETIESTTYIESLTEDKLVTVTIDRKRLKPEMAAALAKSRMIPVEQLLSEVREQRHTAICERVKDK
jgi:hypothetical protein